MEPSTDRTLARRAMLRTGGLAAMAALAGCIGATTGDSKTTDAGEATHEENGHEEDEEFASEAEVTARPDAPVPAATVEMTMVSETEPVFAPRVVWVEAGGSVTWTNVDEEAHTATAYAPAYGKPRRIPDDAGAWDTGSLETGESDTVTFDTPGVYDYYCIPHEGLGMLGTVLVGHPDPAAQPGLAPPQESLPGSAPDIISSLDEDVESLLAD